MTLKEKLKNILIDWIEKDYNRKHISEIIEIYADEYAIEFADWLHNGRFNQYGSHWTNPKIPKDSKGDWVFFTSKQLLEIFKKEKQL
jgi:hypothetical protein